MNNFKVVVIGSGPGGSITALNLLKSGFDVLLIEKGHKYKIDEVKHYSYEEMSKKYNNGGLTVAFGNPNINYVEGSCFGGGSEVNSGLYHRLPKNILENWKKNYKIEYEEKVLNEIYKEIEMDINVSYSDPEKISKPSLKLLEGSDKMNLNCIEIPRWVKTTKKGIIKQSMSETYLKKYISLNGNYILDSEVLSLRKYNNRIELTVRNQKKITLIKTNFLFICSGAIHSPFLLLNSGFREKIGSSLKAHPSFKFIAKFKEEINRMDMGVPAYQIKSFKDITLGCSISNKKYLGMGLIENGNFSQINEWSKLASYYAMISPKSNGKIFKLPFIKSPVVKFNLSKKDMHLLYFAIEKLGEVLLESGATELYPSVNKNMIISNKLELKQIRSVARKKLNLMTIHLFSSLRMGGSKKSSATNPYGQLWSHKNIFVNDSSILCDSPGVNPQGTIMAFSKYNVNNFIDKFKVNEV